MARRSTSQDPKTPAAPASAPKAAPAPQETKKAKPAEPERALVAGSASPLPALPYAGFQPSPYQQRLKSKYWILIRDQPMLKTEDPTPDQVARLVGDAAVSGWCKDPGFRAWFFNEQTFRQDVDWMMELWSTEMARRLLGGLIATKDLIAMGNILARLSGKDTPPDDDNGREMTPEESRALVIKAAKDMGMVFPDDIAGVVDVEPTPEVRQ